MKRKKIIRITTVPISLHLLLKGQFRFMISSGFEVYTISADGPERTEVQKEGAQHLIVPLSRKITPLLDLYCLFKLIGIFWKLRPDIVHTHTPKAGLIGMMAAWICRVPVRMHTVAGLPLMESTGLKRRILLLTEKVTYYCAQKVYPNSAGLQTFMLDELKVPSSKLKIIGKGSSNGINSSFFSINPELQNEAASIRARYAISKADIVFTFIGRVVRDKGVGELLSAFRTHVEQAQSKCFLILVGPFEDDLDPLRDEDKHLLSSVPNIILPGFQKDVRPWLAASDIFVFPSYREGFPNVVLQACCMGVPSIVSDINGNNEIITHGQTGMIVPVKDSEALAKAMKFMTENPAMREEYGRLAKDFVVANFDQQYVWSELLNQYRHLSNSSRL